MLLLRKEAERISQDQNPNKIGTENSVPMANVNKDMI